MTDQPDFNAIYSKSMQSVTDRLTESHLERMRTSAIGGASLSLGVILLLLQTHLDSRALVISLYTSIFAIPAWIAAWQYVESYMFYGKASYGHFNTPKGSLVAVAFAISGMLLLLTSVVSLIWHMSPAAAITFLAVSLLMALIVQRHHKAVRTYAESVEPPGGGV